MFKTDLIENILGTVNPGLRDRQITHCSIDSRKVNESGLFFAFQGENVDGHDFIVQLLKKKVVCIGSREIKTDNTGYVKVNNVLEFMIDLAKERRKQIRSQVIALTGSNGKTSTRQLIVTMLRSVGKSVYATRENYNNHLGLTLTVLNTPDNIDYIVLELGMNHSGEIAALTKIAQPDVSVINNIGCAHIGNFNSMDELANAKLELFDSTQGLIVADMDNKYINEWVKKNEKAKNIFEYHSNNARMLYSDFLKYPRHTIENLYCALNVVKVIKEKVPDLNATLKNVILPVMRGEVKTVGKRKFVVDCYNANPNSVRRSIEEFFERNKNEKDRKLYLVLGSMSELGAFSKSMHRELLNYIKKVSFLEVAFLIGHEFKRVKEDFLNEKKMVFLNDVKGFLKKIPTTGTFLLKGSRNNRLEKVVEYLEKES